MSVHPPLSVLVGVRVSLSVHWWATNNRAMEATEATEAMARARTTRGVEVFGQGGLDLIVCWGEQSSMRWTFFCVFLFLVRLVFATGRVVLVLVLVLDFDLWSRAERAGF